MRIIIAKINYVLFHFFKFTGAWLVIYLHISRECKTWKICKYLSNLQKNRLHTYSILILPKFLQISNVIFHYLGCGLLYIYAAIAWLKTVEVSRVQNKGITRWKKCDLVSNTEDNLNFLQTYRQLQLVDLWVNVIYGNFLLSVHFAGTFVISLATSFLLIRMPGQVSPAMSIFALAGLLSCVSIV